MQRLQRLLRTRPDMTLCRIAKNPAFHLGRTAMLAAKAQDPMMTTAAYHEIRDGRRPLADHLRAVGTCQPKSDHADAENRPTTCKWLVKRQ
jgi:hypothetical protein